MNLTRTIAPLWGALLAVCLAGCATSPQTAAPSSVTLATTEQANAAITARDEYLTAVTAADVSIWLRQPGSAADIDALARHFAESLRPWDAAERARLTAMIERVSPRVTLVAHLLPNGVQIAAIGASATSGADFTRGHTIFLSALQPTDAALDERFFHELFHVISRAHPEGRDALYGIIGFERCTPLVLDNALRARVLTNPDAPVVEYVSRLEIDGRAVFATPLMIADLERYTTTSGLFDHVATQFAPFVRDQQGRCTRDETSTVTQAQLGRALFARAGNNTNYAIHPEELVADNFAQMMMGRADAPSPQIYDQIADVLGIARPPSR